MSNTTSISNFIKQLKAELESSNNDDGSELKLSSAEIRLNFQASSDELNGDTNNNADNDPTLNFQVPINGGNIASHGLTLTFSNKRDSETRSQECDVTVKQNGQQLTLSEEELDNDDFEGFKQRFEKSVKLKHGQTPKKKNIFAD